MTFPERLSQARKRAKKTQRDIAHALGVSVQAVSQWENGQVEINRDRISGLAQALDVDPSWLEFGAKDEALKSIPGSDPFVYTFLEDHSAVHVYRLTDIPHVLKSGDDMRGTVDRSKAIDLLYVRGEKSKFFAVKIEENGLSPDLEDGDVAIFDPYVGAKIGDIVFVLFYYTDFLQIGHSDDETEIPIAGILKRGRPGEKLGPGMIVGDQKITRRENEKPSILILGTMVERRSYRRADIKQALDE